MTSSPNNQKGIVSFFANLPLIRRIKIIKELALEKLDKILSYLNNLNHKTNNILTNDTSLLEALISIVNTIKTTYQQSQNYYHNLLKTIQENSQRYYDKLTEFIQENNQKYYENLVKIVENTNKNIPTLLDNSQSQNNRISLLENQLNNIDKDFSTEISIVKQEIINVQDISKQCLTQQEKIENILSSFNSKKIIINDSSSTLNNPEIGLMMYLYSFLPHPKAIDIGANIGDVSENLLKTGYEVYSFEPCLPTYEKLTSRLGNNPYFHSYQIALGEINETRELYLATDKTTDKIYQDSSLYNSLIKHSMPDDLPFTDSTSVTVKTLASFHDSGEIPQDIGLVKIDTEGFDLQVIKGMGLYKYPVVITEFWDEHIPFGASQTYNKLDDLVLEMRHRNYHWYIVMYRVWGNQESSIAFYSNHCYSIKNSWGNIFFFQDYQLFQQANRWTTSILPETYFR